MFFFEKFQKKNPELEGFIAKIESNMANNYKDNAQDYLKKLEERYLEMTKSGSLSQKQIAYYESQIYNYKKRLKGFTHKDQKPYWT